MTSLDITPTLDQIKALPKALLHDHLDGGLRPQTIIEIADEIGYEKLPTKDPEKLVIELGRLDIHVHVSMLSTFLAAPHQGHLNEVLHIFAYLKCYNTANENTQ